MGLSTIQGPQKTQAIFSAGETKNAGKPLWLNEYFCEICRNKASLFSSRALVNGPKGRGGRISGRGFIHDLKQGALPGWKNRRRPLPSASYKKSASASPRHSAPLGRRLEALLNRSRQNACRAAPRGGMIKP